MNNTNSPFQERYSDLEELVLPEAINIPDLYRKHYIHHSFKGLAENLFEIDKTNISKLSQEQREVFTHVLTRFVFGYQCALTIIPVLEEFSVENISGTEKGDIYQEISRDTQKLISYCQQYLSRVCDLEIDEKALTSNYLEIFKNRLPFLRDSLLESKDLSRKEQVRAEIKLRTVYHLIGEGLGSISGIWGLREAIKQIDSKEEHETLPAMNNLLSLATLIQRRNLVFGLSEINELVKERFFISSLTLLRELKRTKPILEKMRDETFTRWGEEFPFEIDQDQLATAARKRVYSWLSKVLLSRDMKMSTLDGVL